MADALTIQQMINGAIDVDTIGQAANEDMIVTARNGREFVSGPMASRIILEQGTIDAFLFLTKSDLDTGKALGSDTPVTLVDGDFALVLDDETLNNNGYYQKQAAQLVYLKHNPLSQAKSYAESYTDANAASVKNFKITPTAEGMFFTTLDDVALFYVLNDGSFHLAGDTKDLREQVKAINQYDANQALYTFNDSEGNPIAYIDANAELFFIGNNKSVQQRILESERTSFLSLKINSITDGEGKTIFALAATRTFKGDSIKNLVTIEPYPEQVGKVQRIGAALKLADNKILYFWGGGFGGPYNGDGEGVILHKRILTYSDSGYILDKGTKSVFRQPAEPAGIAKHPMLGRTKSGRIILIFDERNSTYTTSTPYNTMICFSDDEGVTFTSPVQIPNNPLFTFQIVGSTGTIITLSTGRIVCPMYYALPSETIGMMYSDDNGATWSYGDTPIKPSGATLQEPSITFDESDKIYISSRTTSLTNRTKYISTSVDGGQTIQNVGFNNQLPTPNVASSIYYDAESKLMLHGGATSTTNRTKYKIQVSADKAITFPVSYQPFVDEFYIGYSQIIKLSVDKYAVVVEGLNSVATVNSKENMGVFIFNLKEVLNNVSNN